MKRSQVSVSGGSGAGFKIGSCKTIEQSVRRGCSNRHGSSRLGALRGIQCRTVLPQRVLVSVGGISVKNNAHGNFGDLNGPIIRPPYISIHSRRIWKELYKIIFQRPTLCWRLLKQNGPSVVHPLSEFCRPILSSSVGFVGTCYCQDAVLAKRASVLTVKLTELAVAFDIGHLPPFTPVFQAGNPQSVLFLHETHSFGLNCYHIVIVRKRGQRHFVGRIKGRLLRVDIKIGRILNGHENPYEAEGKNHLEYLTTK